jgi:6-phosphogluconate dehydrogenase
MWTSETAMELQTPSPTIDVAVAMRDLSTLEDQRQWARVELPRRERRFEGDRESFLKQLRGALHAAMLITYAQGLAVLSAASQSYQYKLHLETVAGIWRGGCIIRAALLEDIRAAYRNQPSLPNPLLAAVIARKVINCEADLRRVVPIAADLGLPAPGFMASLGYLDGYRSAWLPANLIQAQRDYFGAHTYERVDAKGTFHTDWEKR